jgi:phospholipase C
MGLRVPALLASPYLPKGLICSTPLQHTSVLVTVRKLFGFEAPLTKRDAGAPSFENLFIATPRTDAPVTLVPKSAAAAPRFNPERAAPDDVMSEMALHWRRRTGGLPFAHPAEALPMTQDAVHHFLRAQVQAFLDYRANKARWKT